MKYLVNVLVYLLLSISCIVNHSVQAAAPVVPSEHQSKRSSASSWWSILRLFRRSKLGEIPTKRDGFEVLDESVVYSGWRTIVQRKVKMRNGNVVDFDVRT